MYNSMIRWAAFALISTFTDHALTSENVKRVKDFIVSQVNKAVDNHVKHERAAELIRSFSDDLSDTVVDWVVRTILWVARKTGQIPTAQPSEDEE